ncbi:MAG: VOC family protein [Peptococcaceae bacterium]
MTVKYVHTNLVARDRKKLAEFYIDVFNCKPLYPERDLAGQWLAKLTGINDVRIRGIHLELPGYENGPTLEIFQYEPANFKEDAPLLNEQGFRHIAFHVAEVEETAARLVSNGGKVLSEIIKQDYGGLGLLTVVYAQDPEGNFIEIQNWSK